MSSKQIDPVKLCYLQKLNEIGSLKDSPTALNKELAPSSRNLQDNWRNNRDIHCTILYLDAFGYLKPPESRWRVVDKAVPVSFTRTGRQKLLYRSV